MKSNFAKPENKPDCLKVNTGQDQSDNSAELSSVWEIRQI
ncbi:hypothetical protein M595_2482 [Lyngbya aestuarii BL J]|uniref:Uncharacterized protein n=1 Tax=Lyngbya aestuarii BL J TaxID=1348334 RepID=U7QI49_9CYAN|nr:hypothetical protein M595_2482 [Lyngbya aestuarii BL J]